MAEMDPARRTPDKQPTGDDELDQVLAAIEREAEAGIERNATVMDNHLLAADRVITGVAALRSINTTDRLLEKALEAAAADPT